VYLANPPDDDRLYDEYYATELQRDDPQRDAIMTARAACLSELQPGSKLLDIGCGPGWFLKAARIRGFDSQGVDVATGAVEFAIGTLKVQASTDTIEELVGRGSRFDVVTLWHVLEHFHDPLAQLKEIRKLLVPGGLIAIEVPNLNSLKFRLSCSPWQGGNHPLYHRTFFTDHSLSRMLTAAGYRSVHHRSLNYNLPGRLTLLEAAKRVLNSLGLDSFVFITAVA
jgi:2-polyprenyl-3-methyl-5-hydroxy-6-metoxy-1,4-benzoquinol methylase